MGLLLKHSSNTEVTGFPPSEIIMLQLKKINRKDANYVQELRIFLAVLRERNIRLNFQIKSAKISNGETQPRFGSL